MFKSYGDVVEEVYFGKLKTALVIDDEYPILDNFWTEPPTATVKADSEQDKAVKKRFKSVVKSLRSHKPPLIVDIHDGKMAEEEVLVDRFYQSDFLVLDWNLNPEINDKDFSKALKILSHILDNGYFNIVVIDSRTTSTNIHYEILKQFSDSLSGLDNEEIHDIDDLPQSLEDALSKSYSDDTIKRFLFEQRNVRNFEDLVSQIIKSEPKEFAYVIQQGNLHNRTTDAIKSVVLEQIAGFEKSDTNNHELYSHYDTNEKFGWIRAQGAFICTSYKEDDEDPIEVAKRGLRAASLRPEEVVLAALRNELAENGVREQASYLNFRHASALWYFRLLKDSSTSDELFRQFITNHADAMVNGVSPNVIRLANELVDAERKPVVVEAQTPPEATDDALLDDAVESRVDETGAETDVIIEANQSALAFAESNNTLTNSTGEAHGDAPNINSKSIHRENLSNKEAIQATLNRYGIDFRDNAEVSKAADQHNLIVNSMLIGGTHLTSGHIFKLRDEYWACITPACELVPERDLNSQFRFGAREANREALGQQHPIRIQCLKLHPADTPALERAYRKGSGKKLFVVISEKNTPLILATKRKADDKSKMELETFHVDQNSWVEKDGIFSIELLMGKIHAALGQDGEDALNRALEADDPGNPAPFTSGFDIRASVQIVGQLRSEYAASLIRRASLQMSEIGLDYLPDHLDAW